jgi:hypothetical protein
MAILSNAYLKRKIPRLTRVITAEAKTQRALDYEQNNIESSAATITMAELRELSLRVPMVLIGPTMPPSSGGFKVAEDANVVQIDVEDPTKTVQIGST